MSASLRVRGITASPRREAHTSTNTQLGSFDLLETVSLGCKLNRSESAQLCSWSACRGYQHINFFACSVLPSAPVMSSHQ
jgi:hypothetical protein